MCGIAGFNFPDKSLINSMNEAQKHRGPDGDGIFVDDFVSLGHRRLSIIDLSENANQPMEFEKLQIVFNGEIYNFHEIRKELELLGHQFITESDTELILHAYKEWNKDCVHRFNGMWSFCIYDQNKKTFFISRDRFGIKPLYYYFDHSRFIFASEIRSITAHKIDLSLNLEALNYYLWQKYIPKDRSIYSEIKKLLPGCSLILDIEKHQIKTEQYYSLEEELDKAGKIDVEKRIKSIETFLKDAVLKRLLSDVPVGAFLSGGLDSSLISSIIAHTHPNFNVFSIGFNEDTFNELEYAKFVAKDIHVNHHYRILDIEEDLIFKVIKLLDEPFGDPSLIPTFLLSKMTREKVTVALTGDAGDEVFGGYDTYKAYKYAKFIPYFVIRFLKLFTRFISGSDKNLHLSFKFKKFVSDFDKNINSRHLNWMSQTNEALRKNLLKGHYRKMTSMRQGNNLLSLQLNDFENYLCCDILKKTDTASMLNSLESRVPFLDHRLVPLVLSLPEKYKLKGFTTKSLLKKIASEHIPEKIIRRKKSGFSVPLSIWFKRSEKMRDIITDKSMYDHSIFDYHFVQKILKEHTEGKNDHSRVLWLIFIFNIWYKESPLNR